VRDLRLENQGQVSAVTLSGQGGDIDLGVRDLLVLTRNSDISTTAGLAPGGGNGGNIKVNTINGYIFGVPVGDNNFTAQAYLGNGGSITIDAAKIYEIEPGSDDFLNTNDITVSSRYGRVGIIRNNVLNVDPTQGFTNLPVDAVDTSRLIAQRCALRSRTSGRENTFVVTGPGGLPPSPNDTLQNESVVTNWVSLEPPQENPSGNPTSEKLKNSTSSVASVPKTPTYVEAQAWVIDEKGEVILTAQAPTVTPHNPTLTPANVCNGS
jgi:large exoprotein involved in heme utilization and adhesion